ncbi:MAG: GIY-YIG nuclease family protein [Desulfosarcina sp.]|jgi:putative endonuclease
MHQTNVWFVYMLRCGNGALYTGVTMDVHRRVAEHKAAGRRSARFTRSFAPVDLAYSCRVGPKRLAHRIEYRIKRLSREKKLVVVSKNLSKSNLMAFLGLTE